MKAFSPALRSQWLLLVIVYNTEVPANVCSNFSFIISIIIFIIISIIIFIIIVLFFKTFAIQMCVQKSCQVAIENFIGLLLFAILGQSTTV